MTILMPHREIPPTAATWSPWVAAVGAAPGEEVHDQIRGWDYSTRLSLSTSVSLDLNSVLTESGVSDPDRLGFLTKVDCRSSYYQQASVTSLVHAHDGEPVQGQLVIPPGEVADRIVLERAIVLLEGGPVSRPDAATQPGSILLSQRTSVRLEGSGSRMAVEPADFSGMRWSRSPWKVSISYDDIAVDSFAKATSLLLNSSHPAASAAQDPNQGSFQLITSLIKADVIRAHFLKLVTEDREIPVDSDDESVAQILEQHAEAIFNGRLADAIAVMNTDPEEAEALLKSHFDVLGSLT